MHAMNIRRRAINPSPSEPSAADEVAAEVELLSVVEGMLLDGNRI